MEIASKYDPGKAEEKWYQYWLDNGFFRSKPDDREPFTIVIPPPNVTGILHMGHILNNTIQDILVRRARMLGKNACWVPGTDHASIATEAKVVNKLRSEGLNKYDIGREAFLEEAWKWKEKHGGLILNQLQKLGASCDWDRTRFTMEESLSEAVIDTFIDLYKKDLIYRGTRMINWDPAAKTALSDEEVIHKEVTAMLYYVRYAVEGSDEHVVIATTRPETIMGDTAVCVNPKDERYRHLVGKNVMVPLINRAIPVIEDDYVDIAFGTGCLKVTPAHDINDHELGKRHHLDVIDILNEDGTLNEHARLCVGMDREAARKEISNMLKEQGFLEKTEQLTHSVGFSERTDAVVEPRLSQQWFCKMSEMAKPALENVMNDEIRFHPPKFKNVYRHWMENIKDWCISRQLWWGHRIPAWYNEAGEFMVAKSKEEAANAFREAGKDDSNLRQDEDVLDTWFSSWLWPISVFDGFEDPGNEDIRYYYPTNDLVTAPDIIFFWVARMIMIGYEYRGEKPFKNVYFTGVVRDKLRRKMSKSLGNSPDPLDLIRIYGADGVRVGMLLSAPAGNDLLFDESLCEQGRNFANKIWNAFRLVKGWEVEDALEQPAASAVSVRWFRSQLSETIGQINKSYEEFRISEALMSTYKLIWDEFCSWYLEMIKPAYQQPVDRQSYEATIAFFEDIIKLLHPFMPFISEEIWQQLGQRQDKATIIWETWPVAREIDVDLLADFEIAREVIAGVRNFRKEKNVAQKESLQLFVRGKEKENSVFGEVICKLTNLEEIVPTAEKKEQAYSFVVRTDEYFIPMEASIDIEEEIAKVKKELDYTKGFLASIEKKLSNERFVNSAPQQVVEMERKKKADAEARLRVLEEQLASWA